jgi:peptidyl-prolyl cis-trans isomerase C
MKSNRSSVVSNAFYAALLATPALLGIVACKPNVPESPAPSSPASQGAPAEPKAASPAQAPAPGGQPAPATPAPASAKDGSAGNQPASSAPQNLPGDLASLLNSNNAPAAPLPDVVATVEGQDIKKEELEQALVAALGRQGIPADQMPANQKAQGYKMLLNDLITEKLVTKRAASIEVKDEDINAQFEQLRSRFPTPEAFQEQLTKSGQTVEKIRADIRSYLRQQNWVQDQVKDAPKATDADAEEFYTKNPDQFKKPEQVRASHILISVPADANEEQIGEKKKAAEAVASRVKGGEAFDKLASELSEDPSAKQNAGDLNFFSREQMVPEFSEAAFGMKKGDISDPVKSQFGFHIIQVTDRKEAETMTLDSVKPRLLAFLSQRMRDSQVEKMIKELREKADVKVNLP